MGQDAPTRAQADSVLAKVPWPRVCKELWLYAAIVGAAPGAPEAALEAAQRDVWSFRERSLWAYLTGKVDESLVPAGAGGGHGGEVARVPSLSAEGLDRELLERGIDPSVPAAHGERLKRERSAKLAAATRDATPAPPASRVPVLTIGQWAALALVVLVMAGLAAGASLFASRGP